MRAICAFSCIGNHAIGLARAGIVTTSFCEIDPWRRDRIADIFPGVDCHDDIRTFEPARADVLIGGPPCQRTSVAAAIHGYRDGDSLWPYMLQVGNAVRPEWIVVEQPPGNAAWEAQVADDLCRVGYHTARIEFGACDVGAPYLRRRVFVVASTSLSGLEVAWRQVPSEIESVKRAANARGDWNTDQLRSLPVDARSAREFDRGVASDTRRKWIEALGDSNPPHMAEVIGRAIMFSTQQAA